MSRMNCTTSNGNHDMSTEARSCVMTQKLLRASTLSEVTLFPNTSHEEELSANRLFYLGKLSGWIR